MKKSVLFIIIGIIIGGWVAYGIVRHMAVQQAEMEIIRLVENTPALEEVRYDKIGVGMFRSTFNMQDIEIRLAGYKEPLRINHLKLDVAKPTHRIPPKARAEIQGIHLTTQHELFHPLRADLEAMGYQEIDGLITLAYEYDAAGKRLNLNDITIQADQMGKVHLDLALTDLDLSRLLENDSQPDLSTLFLAMPMVALAGGQLTYADDSFFGRLFHENPDPNWSNYRLNIKEQLNQRLKAEKNERVRQILSTLNDFVDKPATVTISVNPSRPVPFLRFLWIKKPADLIELLNVRVSM